MLREVAKEVFIFSSKFEKLINLQGYEIRKELDQGQTPPLSDWKQKYLHHFEQFLANLPSEQPQKPSFLLEFIDYQIVSSFAKGQRLALLSRERNNSILGWQRKLQTLKTKQQQQGLQYPCSF